MGPENFDEKLTASVIETERQIEALGAEKLRLLINRRFHPDSPMADMIGKQPLPLENLLTDQEWGELYTLHNPEHLVSALQFCNRVRSYHAPVEIQKLKLIYHERIGRMIQNPHDRLRVQGVVTSVMRRRIEQLEGKLE